MILLDLSFKNLLVVLQVFYFLNIHVKFHSIQMLFIIPLIKIFFLHNFTPLKFKIYTLN